MIRVANAPCSWGVLEFDSDDQAAPYDQVLDEMQKTGYAGTELGDWGFMPTDPSQLWRDLARRDLALLGAFVPVALANPQTHDEGIARAVKTAQLLAAVAGNSPFIVLADDNGQHPGRTQNAGRIGTEDMLDDEQWDNFATGATSIACAVRDQTGLRTVFHHHAAGFVETPQELDRLLSLTDAQLLGLCLDTGHFCYGGGDPLAAIEKYGPRIWHVHFKDFSRDLARQARRESWDYFDAVRHGIFCELGQGDVDFPAVVRALEALAYDGWIVVEQDVLPGLGAPKESAGRNRVYLQSLGL